MRDWGGGIEKIPLCIHTIRVPALRQFFFLLMSNLICLYSREIQSQRRSARRLSSASQAGGTTDMHSAWHAWKTQGPRVRGVTVAGRCDSVMHLQISASDWILLSFSSWSTSRRITVLSVSLALTTTLLWLRRGSYQNTWLKRINHGLHGCEDIFFFFFQHGNIQTLQIFLTLDWQLQWDRLYCDLERISFFLICVLHQIWDRELNTIRDGGAATQHK